MDDAALEVHALPFQAADLLPPQTQPSGDLDHHLQPVALYQLVEHLQVLLGIIGGLVELGAGRLHPLHGIDPEHILPHCHPQGGGEQVMVPADGVGREPLRPRHGLVVLLDLLGAELRQGDGAQQRVQVVVDDLLIRIHRSLRPVGADDVLHPVIQPLAQGLLLLGRVEELVPIGVKLPQARPGGGQVGEGAVLLDPLPLAVLAQIHADIIYLSHVIKGNVAFHSFPCHKMILSFCRKMSFLQERVTRIA